jgi:hypothetical protein
MSTSKDVFCPDPEGGYSSSANDLVAKAWAISDVSGDGMVETDLDTIIRIIHGPNHPTANISPNSTISNSGENPA